ncbi:SPOR domain-containing protein [Neolewinella lacunae]|uniref:SPOR domain-containing protein n=1 Tax=Neolewinella lacunae TaxID=1517758 RepID=A0A923PIK7_9BACT|nr:SPOR domain-containing protein [Neolewinella lacunae]MBC6994740.1 SPOR domain-containing protein [Neolewinella lacunae]MDN3634362.1 SPOR domain-containing protein [Neolewinella lacunae]
MLRFTFLLLFALPATLLVAQSSVSITAETGIEGLLELFQTNNEAQDKVDGWRVQILATQDRARLEAVESEFKVNYPSVPVDWVHNNPYYKLRAGAFVTKQEAERLKFTLGRQFEGVYLVKDEIKESELLRMY